MNNNPFENDKECEFITVDIPNHNNLDFMNENEQKKADPPSGFMKFLKTNDLLSKEEESDEDFEGPLLYNIISSIFIFLILINNNIRMHERDIVQSEERIISLQNKPRKVIREP